jgi:hypothetical protein
VTLLLVSLQYLDFRKTQMPVEDMEIDGTGILHIIWLYRNHQGLQSALDQVDSPTNQKLREAGMIQARLAGEGHGPRNEYPKC